MLKLIAHYGQLTPEARVAIDPVIVGEITSDDPTVRFDALVLVSEFRIVNALPALELLHARLSSSDSAPERFEAQRAQELIDQLRDDGT
jgi:hypothetical protein